MNPMVEPPSALERALLKQGNSFSFFQAVRILKRIRSGTDGDILRIRPSLSLDFPGSDVAKVNPLPQGYEIITTFLGLYGISSPLPAFYTEDLMTAESEDQSAARALLDIIHQRVYSLFYQSLKKYRPQYQVVEDQTRAYPDLLFSILGLRDETLSKKIPNPHRLMRYTGLFSQQPRSAAGLKTLLEDAFPGIVAEILQCIPRRVKIPPDQRLILGEGESSYLGFNAVLGEELEDRTGKIIVSVGPLTREQFHKLMNVPDQWNTLIFLIQFYLTVPIECDLELVLAENQAKTTTLGAPEWSCLGKNAWTFSGDECGQVRSTLPLNLADRPI